MAESEFLERVRNAFAHLLAANVLSVTDTTHDPAAFGSSVVELTGTRLSVRLVSDRDDEFADIRIAHASEWRPLERVLQAIGASDTPPEGFMSPEVAARLLGAHYRAIEKALETDAIERTLGALRERDGNAAKSPR